MNMPIVALENVSRLYPNGQVTALRHVSLEVAHGEFLAVVGPSGSGKSTLLHLLGGLDKPSSGELFFEGHQPQSGSEWARIRAERIGFVFQSFNLLPNFSALENVELPMMGVERDLANQRSRAEFLLERVGLSDRMVHRPSELSAGQQQRVAIARSLANSPDLVLADEPTGNLDSKTAIEIFELLKSINADDGAALVVVTHDPDLPGRADRIIEIIDGEVSLS